MKVFFLSYFLLISNACVAMELGDALYLCEHLSPTQKRYMTFAHTRIDQFYDFLKSEKPKQLTVLQERFKQASLDFNMRLLEIIPDLADELNLGREQIIQIDHFTPNQKTYCILTDTKPELWYQFVLKPRPEKLAFLRRKFSQAAAENNVNLLRVIPRLSDELYAEPKELSEGLHQAFGFQYQTIGYYSALYNAINAGHYEATKEILNSITLDSHPKDLFYMASF